MALEERGDYQEAKGEKANKRDTPQFWERWITVAKRAAYQHWQDSSRAWREDNAQNGNSIYQDGQRRWSGSGGIEWDGARYPIWWSTNQLMRSAFYSRTPEIYCRRVFGIEDRNALTQTLIMDRLGRYAIEVGDLDCSMRDCVADYLNSDKTTTQVCVKYEKVKKKERLPVLPGAEINQFLDAATGQPVTEAILQDPQTGELYYETDTEVVDVKHVYSRSVPYDHIIHTPTARIFQEITDIGFYFCFTRDEAIERFGEETVKSWPTAVWKHTKNMIDRDEQTHDSNNSGKYQIGESSEKSADLIIEGWEIWSNITKKVYWYCPAYPEEFLEAPKEDPYKLKNFFPCAPFVIGSKPNKNMYPCVPFVRLWPTIDMFHIMYGRVMNLIDGARRRALVAGDDEVVAALNQIGDAEFISCQEFQNLVSNIGLDKLVWYVPVQELVNCIAELNAQDEKFKANYDEWRGVPDILRGQSDPIETAAAVETKVSAAHDRFKNDKKAIADLARDTIELMVDMYLYLFDDEKIARIVGYQFMQPEDQQQFPAALAALRNDEERTIRIEVETDTTSYLGEQIRIQQRNAAVTTVIKGLESIQPLIETSPAGAAVAARVMAESLDGYGAGRQFVEDVQRYINEWVKKLEAPPPDQGPPPPDYEIMKIEVARMNAETNRMKAEGESYKAQMEQMRQDFQLQLTQQKQQFDQWVQQNYLALDANRIAAELENKTADNERLNVEAQAKVIEAMKPTEQDTTKKGEAPTTIIVNNAAGTAPAAVPDIPIDILGSI
jgi:hypothetical protein